MTGRRLSLAALLAASVLLGAMGGASASGWSDYQIIMWQPQTASGYRLLQTIGVTAAMLRADRDHPRRLIAESVRPLLDSDMRWYVENIATDFYSAYHRYFPDRPVNWRFLAVQKLYRANPQDQAAFVRDPSLSDPSWLEKIGDRLRDTVDANRRYHPLFYNLADEPGIADLNAFWDFDFSPPSLAAMREWLKSRYGSLSALNAEWGSRFANWGAVTPMTTAEAMRRTDGNFAAWADFKAWMDVAFARAFDAGRKAVHAADPDALAGLEGGQKIGWGGYDYATLANAVDVMETEPELFSLVRSLNPRLHLLSTSFGGGPAEDHRIWRALLNGGRGIIIWDAKHEFVAEDGTLGPRGNAAAQQFAVLRGGLGALLINSTQSPGIAGILYSPESLRVQWLLDWKDKGDAWLGRGADEEDRDDGTVRAAMNAYARSLEQLGFAPRYVSPAMVEKGALRDGSYRLLVLPHAIALSAAEAMAIDEFAAHGGLVIADTAPGLYDERGRKLAKPRLAALFRSGRAIELSPGVPRSDDGADPPVRIAAGDVARLGAALARVGISPRVRLQDENGTTPTGIAVRTYRNGDVRLLALQRDFPALAPARIAVHLRRRAYVYDLRARTFLGHERALHVAIDRVAPAFLALSPRPLPRPAIAVPPSAHPGKSVRIGLGLAGPSPAALDVLHVAVSDPSGRAVGDYATNVIMRHREAVIDLPLAQGASVGTWTITVVDLLSGRSARAALHVAPSP